MICNPFSSKASLAIKRYTAGMALTNVGYLLAVFGTSSFVHRHHPSGVQVYLLAVMPSFCILAMLSVVAIYLRDEKDEYKRMQFVRSLLVATFAILALSAFTDFLRSYGDLPGLPPFAEFVSFWIIFAFAQGVQSLGDRSHE